MNICPSCKQKEKQFKILQADLQFEIKKRTQDLAQEKVTIEQHFQRQSKKIIEKYQKEKHQRQQESKKWIEKYDVMVYDYEHKIIQLHATYQQKHSLIENQIKLQYKQEKQEYLIKQNQILQTINNKHIQQIEEMKSQHLLQIRRLKKIQEDTVKKINQQNQTHIKSLTCEYDSKIKNLKKEVADANDTYIKQKKEDHQKQTALYEDLYQRKEEINNLKYQIDQLEKQVEIGEQQLRFKVLQIEVLREQHHDKIETMKSDFQKQKEAIVVDLSHKIQNLLKNKLQDCQKFEQVVRDIDGKRNIQAKLYECSLKQIKELVDRRPSRDEDLQQISLLRKLLDQKETEFQNILEEAKHCRLELNNKQETFNRIFTAYTSPLNLDKINKKKQLKLSRGRSAFVKEPISKYNSVTTLHSIPPNCDSRKDKLVYPKSTKLF